MQVTLHRLFVGFAVVLFVLAMSFANGIHCQLASFGFSLAGGFALLAASMTHGIAVLASVMMEKKK